MKTIRIEFDSDVDLTSTPDAYAQTFGGRVDRTFAGVGSDLIGLAFIEIPDEQVDAMTDAMDSDGDVLSYDVRD